MPTVLNERRITCEENETLYRTNKVKLLREFVEYVRQEDRKLTVKLKKGCLT